MNRTRTGRRLTQLMLGLCTAIGLTATAWAGQPRDHPAEVTGTASISGRVQASSPRAPLSDVIVSARAGNRGVTKLAVTDADGRYALTGLPPGRYTVSARKGGYLTIQYGQMRAFEPGTPLQIEAGQALARIDLQLPRGSVLTGIVFDQHGEPAVGAMVRARRYQFASGRWDLVGVGSFDSSDDRGFYRLFGLPPGDYYIEVTATAMFGRLAPRAPVYYPSAPDFGSAQRVSVGIGEEVGGLDVILTEGDTGQVSGLVVDARGRPQTGARSVNLVGRHPPGLRVRSGQIRADGSFMVEAVPPGEYVLYASTPASEGPVEFAAADLVIIGEDVENIVLRTTIGATATGTLVVDGNLSDAFAPEDLLLFTMPQGFVDVPVGRGTGRVDPDWSFEIGGMGDAQLVRLLGLPDGWVLEAVLLNGRNITDQPVHLPAGRTTGGFRIVVTDRTTRLRATIVDDDGRPVTDCRVVIFAADATRWQYPSRFVRAERPDQHGTIDVRGLPTEHYLVFAATGIPRGAETNPEFLGRIRPTATSFTLGAGETRHLTIRTRLLP